MTDYRTMTDAALFAARDGQSDALQGKQHFLDGLARIVQIRQIEAELQARGLIGADGGPPRERAPIIVEYGLRFGSAGIRNIGKPPEEDEARWLAGMVLEARAVAPDTDIAPMWRESASEGRSWSGWKKCAVLGSERTT